MIQALLYLLVGVVYAILILFLYEKFVRKSDVVNKIGKQKIKGDNGEIDTSFSSEPKKRKKLSFRNLLKKKK